MAPSVVSDTGSTRTQTEEPMRANRPSGVKWSSVTQEPMFTGLSTETLQTNQDAYRAWRQQIMAEAPFYTPGRFTRRDLGLDPGYNTLTGRHVIGYRVGDDIQVLGARPKALSLPENSSQEHIGTS